MAEEFAFITSSQVMLILRALGPHLSVLEMPDTCLSYIKDSDHLGFSEFIGGSLTMCARECSYNTPQILCNLTG